MDKLREDIKNLAKTCHENYEKILKSIILLQVVLLVGFFILNVNKLILDIVLGLAPFVVYILAKDIFSDEEKEKYYKINSVSFVFSILNFALYFIQIFVVMLVKNQGASGTIKYSTMSGLGFFIAIIIFFLFMITKNNQGFKDFAEKFQATPILSRLGIDLISETKKDGDVQLCKDLNTEVPIVLPKKDRYLHMLILGPTGSGKTSQIILPMLHQDVQNLNAGITVLEPKGDLAEKVYAMCQFYGRPALYFNPILDSCPTFNPLYGKEEDVIENMTTTIKMLAPDSPQFFQDMGENLMRNALKVLKRTKGNNATMIDLYRLIANTKESRPMVQKLITLPVSPEEAAENADVAQYFMNDYFNDKSKTFEHCSGVRAQISKIVSNKFLRKVLNPVDNRGSDIDWDAHLKNGTVLCITTAQGSLRDLGSFLGYLLILSFQSSVFKRPGNEDSRKDHFLYIDEFQKYSNPGFADMLTQGRSYRVASHLATQNRALIGMGSGKEGKDFIELVSTNARNIVIFPGANYTDAKYYSDQFGQIIERKLQTGVSQAQFNPLYGFQPIGYANKSVRESEEEVARFTPDDIIYKPFGQITFSIIKNNSIQIPNQGKIEYIPRELNKRLDEMIPENHALMLLGYNPNKCRILSERGCLVPEIQEKISDILEKAEAISNGHNLSMENLAEDEKLGVDIRVDNEMVELSEDDIPIPLNESAKSGGIPIRVQVDSAPPQIETDDVDDFEE